MKLIFLLTLIYNFNFLINADSNLNSIYNGRITTYGGNINGGSCGFRKLKNLNSLVEDKQNILYGVAMNSKQYDNSLSCGQCIEIIDYKKLSNQLQFENKILFVTDKCPECNFGELDLSQDAWDSIINKPYGIDYVNWRFINCPTFQLENKIILEIDEINYYWLSIRPTQFKCGLVSIEIFMNNNWHLMNRNDNIMTGLYFIISQKVELPFKFRLTNIYNEIIYSDEFYKIENQLIINNQFNCNHNNSLNYSSNNSLNYYSSDFKNC